MIVAMGLVLEGEHGELSVANLFQELLGLLSFADKSRVYVDFVAGTLVLVNSLVMLAPGPAEYAMGRVWQGLAGCCDVPCDLVMR